MARNYAKEYRDYHGKPSQIKRRSNRNKARRKLLAAGVVRKGDGRDVHHKDSNPNNNSRANLSAVLKGKNRSMNGKRKKRKKQRKA